MAWLFLSHLFIKQLYEITIIGRFFFMVDEDTCTRCQLCIDRCPTNVITLGKFEGSVADQAAEAELPSPWAVDTGARDHKNGYVYGVRGM